ncbi:hypothetical protein MRO73_18930 [Dickeya dianthicola]|nr:hypothetical protein [Dickeya dianthicola]MCI4004601.1 hypothetical protein [Dickeya dianthicola]
MGPKARPARLEDCSRQVANDDGIAAGIADQLGSDPRGFGVVAGDRRAD